MKILSAVKKFFLWFYYLLWEKPVTPEPEERFRLKAQELNLENAYTVIEYKGQRINLNKFQLTSFHNMNRDAKRKVLEYWRKLERKGLVKFVEINGKTIAVRNKDYEGKAEDVRQQRNDQTG